MTELVGPERDEGHGADVNGTFQATLPLSAFVHSLMCMHTAGRGRDAYAHMTHVKSARGRNLQKAAFAIRNVPPLDIEDVTLARADLFPAVVDDAIVRNFDCIRVLLSERGADHCERNEQGLREHAVYG